MPRSCTTARQASRRFVLVYLCLATCCFGPKLVAACYHVLPVLYRVEFCCNITQIDASITGQPLLTVLRNFVPLVQTPKQFEALQLTDFTVSFSFLISPVV